MKKSKIVGIGLLALSIASCQHKKKHHFRDITQYQNNPNYYIDNGDGYQQCDGGYPFYFYNYYAFNGYGGIYPHPGFVYRTYGGRSSYAGSGSRSGGFRSSFGGRTTSVSHSSVSRGGFGSSGGHAGA